MKQDSDKRVLDLWWWRRTPREKKVPIATNVANVAKRNTRSDPYIWERVFNSLLNGIETPSDYGVKNWRG